MKNYDAPLIWNHKKYHIPLVLLLMLLLFIVANPSLSMTAAADGLLLWYSQVLPALLPLAILTNLMVYSNYMQIVTKYMYPLTRRILPTSQSGCFAFLGGVFFGFPMGSKISADLVKEGRISRQEGEILAICFNQLSPVFLSGYLMTSVLHMPEMIGPGYAALYAPPLLWGFLRLKRLGLSAEKKKAPAPRLDFEVIDAGIMNGFESLTKLGGYIVLFSVFAAMLHAANRRFPLANLVCTGLVEVTTGISCLEGSGLPPQIAYALAMFFAAFGGLCGFAQTCSMARGCGFSKWKYLACRLGFAAASGGAGYLLYALCVH